MISFSCQHCGLKFQVQPEFAGRSTRCPTCKQPLVVPRLDETLNVETGRIDGAASSLARADVAGGVTLDQPADSTATQTPIRDVLAGQPHNGDRYIVADEIARGGMGAVLRAVDCDIRREVAIKYMLGQDDSGKKLRFVEEAQITGQLEHPNIVPIHELGVDSQQRIFFAMKLVKGRSLAQVLDALRQTPQMAEKDFSLGRLLQIFINVCHAVAYAHSRGVVHRDLKPANIMVGDFGEVYVMDWGLAKVLRAQDRTTEEPTVARPPAPVDSSASDTQSSTVATSRESQADLTQEGAILGTPVYMPPEQAMGQVHAVDRRSDVYSLGAILYELLALEPPVERQGGASAILIRVVQGEIVPPERRSPQRAAAGKVPRELSAVALKALACIPANRYPSVAAMRQDVERYLEGRSVSARQDTTWESLARLVRRHKGVSAATGVALVLLAVILGVSFTINYEARLRAEEALGRAEAAQGQAEKSLAAFESEQAQREKQGKDSIPAFLRAGRLAANEGNFKDALAQVEAARRFDRDSAEAQLLKGEVLILRQNFRGAAAELRNYLQVRPGDAYAAKLVELCGRVDPNEPRSLMPIIELFAQMKEFTEEPALRHLRNKVLSHYRARVEKAWLGRGRGLTMDPQGKLELNLEGAKGQVSDLSALKGMPLSKLNLYGCTQVKDLRPLKGMPLTSLILQDCHEVHDLAPLRGMQLTYLNLAFCSISDLRLLKDMPLATLLVHCSPVTDLSPLRDLPIKYLHLNWCPVQDLKPLRGMPLTNLGIAHTPVWDLSPLRGMSSLKELHLDESRVEDLTPLADLQLQRLTLTPKTIKRGMEVLRHMDSVKGISVVEGGKAFEPKEFWMKFDAKGFNK